MTNSRRMLHIVLLEPEIPPNTGNLIRLCANTGATLHLIEPLGFSLETKALRRAGLDYHEFAELQCHANFEACMENLSTSRWFAFSTKGSRFYTTPHYQEDDVLLFGPETRGLPTHILDDPRLEDCLRLPMTPNSRSLNLANSVSVATYEVWRQLGFSGGN